MASKKIGVQNWRAPGLPGLTAPIPVGAKGLAIGPRTARKLVRIVRTFDNVKAVAALAPYAQSAEEVRDALIAELTVTYGLDVGPTVCLLVEVTGMLTMWSRFLHDQAAERVGKEESPSTETQRLLQLAMITGDSAKSNVLAAHELARKLAASRAEAIEVKDALDEFGEPPSEFKDEEKPEPEPEKP